MELELVVLVGRLMHELLGPITHHTRTLSSFIKFATITIHLYIRRLIIRRNSSTAHILLAIFLLVVVSIRWFVHLLDFSECEYSVA